MPWALEIKDFANKLQLHAASLLATYHKDKPHLAVPSQYHRVISTLCNFYGLAYLCL